MTTLDRELVRLADAVGRPAARQAALAGRTVTLKVRFGDFRTITRSSTLPGAVDSGPLDRPGGTRPAGRGRRRRAGSGCSA